MSLRFSELDFRAKNIAIKELELKRDVGDIKAKLLEDINHILPESNIRISEKSNLILGVDVVVSVPLDNYIKIAKELEIYADSSKLDEIKCEATDVLIVDIDLGRTTADVRINTPHLDWLDHNKLLTVDANNRLFSYIARVVRSYHLRMLGNPTLRTYEQYFDTTDARFTETGLLVK